MVRRGGLFPVFGGPSTGKSAVITAFKERGYRVLPEIGTIVIHEGVYHPEKNRHQFQMEVLRRQLEMEARCDPDERYFCDRGLLDGPAYYLMHGLAVPPEFATVRVDHYLLGFLLEPLEAFERNDVRPPFEDLAYARKITPLLGQSYANRGVPYHSIPPVSVLERVDLIERHVQAALALR